jgi:hypothetical protein
LTEVLDLVVSILASVSILFTLYFAWKAYQSYSQTSHETYSVGQQRARVATQVNLVWSLVLLVISLILFGVSGLNLGPAEAEPLPSITDTPPLAETVTGEATTAVDPLTTPTATPTLAPLVTVDLGQTATATTAAAPPTLTSAPIAPTGTPTSAPATAVVSSGVGVWLRAEPSTAGEQLEWLLDGTVVTVMPGLQQADDFEWQQVRTADGIEGWVATDFIVYNSG